MTFNTIGKLLFSFLLVIAGYKLYAYGREVSEKEVIEMGKKIKEFELQIKDL